MDDSLPVVVELFTSQGCSSCPPADRLLAELATDTTIGPVIPLAFHVDYWNYLGWEDPYSSEIWSDRQADYAGAFGASSLYTPQIVVQGKEQAIGSSKGEVLAAIHTISKSPRQEIQAHVVNLDTHEVLVRAESGNDLEFDSNAVDYVLILFQKGERTKVVRGENAGQSLENKFIVRKMEKTAYTAGEVDMTLKYDGLDFPQKHGLVILLQNRLSREIYGSIRVE